MTPLLTLHRHTVEAGELSTLAMLVVPALRIMSSLTGSEYGIRTTKNPNTHQASWRQGQVVSKAARGKS